MLPRFLPLLLLFVASCNPCCFGQIELKSTEVRVLTGLQNAQVVGGTILFDAESKPVITNAAMVEVTSEQKASTIEALQIPTLEPGNINPAGENRWLLTGSGSYLVTAYASTPTFQIRHLKVELSNEPPKPPPGPGPPKPPEPSNDTDKLVDDAMLELRRGYGKAFASAADAIQSGQITIDAQLQSFMEPITKKARMDALAGIDGHIEDLIPRDGTNLKPEAAGFIRALSVSFERGTK